MVSGRLEAEYRGPPAGDLRRPAVNSVSSPFAHVRTAVYVQHLPGNMASFRKINDRVRNFLRVGDRAHGVKALEEILRIVLVEWGIDYTRRDRVEADVVFRVFTGQAD